MNCACEDDEFVEVHRGRVEVDGADYNVLSSMFRFGESTDYVDGVAWGRKRVERCNTC